MSISMRQLQLDMDPCSNGGTISLDALSKLHRWGGPSYESGKPKRPDIISLCDMGHRHSKVFRLLWLNAYLMPTIDWSVAGIKKGKVEGAPMIAQRAAEIAWKCGNRYDCIALCEVWREDSSDQILQNMDPKNPPSARGSSGGTREIKVETLVKDFTVATIEILSSGLLTMNPGHYTRIGDNREKFNNEGVFFRDADAYSNKGILQVVVETGFNTKLEIYSTHLIKGGDFIDISEEDQINIQTEQIKQLVSFINKTHVPHNFIIVAGDFNIDASKHYEALRSIMEDTLGLEDVWTRYAQSRYGAKLGITEYSTACQGDSKCSEFADDGIGGNVVDDHNRIDYIFIQRPDDSPKNGQDINVEVARPRRRHFPRDPSAPGYGQIQHLSDHSGIELKLFVSGK